MLRGHLSVRSHLEDLAKRHPDLAGHLRCPPWGGEPSSRDWNRKRTAIREDNSSEGPSDPNQNQAECTESSPDKKQFEENMDKQQQQPPFENNSRSQENEDKPQRFVSKLEFTPVNSSNQPENVQPSVQPQHHYQNESQNDTFASPHGTQKQSSNVRHIPIYVEGRSEPVYPKNVEQIFNENNGASLPKRAPGKPAPFAQHHSFHDQNTAQRRQTPPSQQQRQQTPPQESRSTPPPPLRQQVKPIDALEKVQNVQAEVDELATAVNQFTGSSRTDKQFIYLDEMLTRNLIKLDTIETEGNICSVVYLKILFKFFYFL